MSAFPLPHAWSILVILLPLAGCGSLTPSAPPITPPPPPVSTAAADLVRDREAARRELAAFEAADQELARIEKAQAQRAQAALPPPVNTQRAKPRAVASRAVKLVGQPLVRSVAPPPQASLLVVVKREPVKPGGSTEAVTRKFPQKIAVKSVKTTAGQGNPVRDDGNVPLLASDPGPLDPEPIAASPVESLDPVAEVLDVPEIANDQGEATTALYPRGVLSDSGAVEIGLIDEQEFREVQGVQGVQGLRLRLRLGLYSGAQSSISRAETF